MEPKAVVNLRKGEGRTIKAGGLWIFDNEIESVMGSVEDGDIVIVRDFDGYPMGRGFINRKSKITVRMLTRDAEQDINEAFLRMRVKNAWEYRKAVMQGDDLTCCRVIFGEADFLPGLVIDRFSDVLVVESLALGIDLYKEQIVDLLKEIMAQDGVKIRGVYERSDAKVRKKEGLAPYKGCIGAEFDPVVEIVENGVRYKVDVANGQKTGFFLDQKYNRLAMQKLIKGLTRGEQETPLRVLDCFTHMGTFALNCGYAGASDVLGLDISEYAVEQARENAKLNHMGEDKIKFSCGNLLADNYIGKGTTFQLDRSTIKETQHLDADRQYDIVVANILADVIVPLSAVIGPYLKDDGYFITSGILDVKEKDVTDAMIANGFEVIDVVHMNDWVSVIGKKTI